MGIIAFASRFERIALQAADLLSHCVYHVEEYRLDTKRPDIAYALHYLASKENNVKRLDADSIPLLMRGYPQELVEQDKKRGFPVSNPDSKAS